jgi:hypothetical protein
VVAVHHIPFLLGGREDHHRDGLGAGVALELSQDLHTVHLGQFEIQEHEPRGLLEGSLAERPAAEQEIKRLLAVSGQLNPVGQVVASQCQKRQFHIGWVVFHQQNLDG